MKKIIIFILIVAVLVGGFLAFFKGESEPEKTVMTFTEYRTYIVDQLVREEYPGIRGIDANTLIAVFAGLKNEDFHRINTGYGEYEVHDGGIAFRPSDGEYVDDKLFLTNENVLELIDIVAKRLNKTIDTREGFEELITSIK